MPNFWRICFANENTNEEISLYNTLGKISIKILNIQCKISKNSYQKCIYDILFVCGDNQKIINGNFTEKSVNVNYEINKDFFLFDTEKIYTIKPHSNLDCKFEFITNYQIIDEGKLSGEEK